MHYPQFCQKASGEFCHPIATVFVIALLTTLFCLLSIQWLDLPLTLWMAQQKENLPVLQSFFKFFTMFGKGVALIAPALVMVLVLWWLDRRAHQPLAKGINKFLSEKKLLIKGGLLLDGTILFFDEKYWLFATKRGDESESKLFLYHSKKS
jgi:hypothetical protein